MTTGEPKGHDANPPGNFTQEELNRLNFLKQQFSRINTKQSSGKNIDTQATREAERILHEASHPFEKVLKIRQELLTTLLNNRNRKVSWPYGKDGLTADTSTIIVSAGIHKDNFQIDLEAKSHRITGSSDDVQRYLTMRYNEIESDSPSLNDTTQVSYLIEIEPDGNFLVSGHTMIGDKEVNSSYYNSREPNAATIGIENAIEIIDHISQEYIKASTPK